MFQEAAGSSFFRGRKSSLGQRFKHIAHRSDLYHHSLSSKLVGQSSNKQTNKQANKQARVLQASASCRRQTLVIGLSSWFVFVLISSLRTRPLLSGNVWMTFPIIQELRGAVSSTMRTMSPHREVALLVTPLLPFLTVSQRQSDLVVTIQKLGRICDQLHKVLIFP